MIGKHHKYTAIFCREALNNIQTLTDLLARLRQDPDPALLNGIFRATHTLKGNAFGMGFSDIASLSETMESFFDQVKKQKVAIQSDAFDTLDEGLNELRNMVHSLRDPEVRKNNFTDIQKKLGLITADLRHDTEQKIHYHEVEPRPFDPEPIKGDQDSLKRKPGPPDEEDTQSTDGKIAIDCLAHKLSDIVRFTAQAIEKEATLHFEGGETQVNYSILPVIDRILLQLLRNAVAHGIEKSFRRIHSGKHPSGTISLSASTTEEMIVIEVRDDGRGLDYERIRKVATAQGLISVEEASRLGEEQLSQFIFEPGFSTAESISFIAGRGTGMDIVKTEINSIGGAITVTSIEGVGTSFVLTLPVSPKP
jgi:two-component system chemotaxis sensor kinase CheA